MKLMFGVSWLQFVLHTVYKIRRSLVMTLLLNFMDELTVGSGKTVLEFFNLMFSYVFLLVVFQFFIMLGSLFYCCQ